MQRARRSPPAVSSVVPPKNWKSIVSRRPPRSRRRRHRSPPRRRSIRYPTGGAPTTLFAWSETEHEPALRPGRPPGDERSFSPVRSAGGVPCSLKVAVASASASLSFGASMVVCWRLPFLEVPMAWPSQVILDPLRPSSCFGLAAIQEDDRGRLFAIFRPWRGGLRASAEMPRPIQWWPPQAVHRGPR